MPKIPWYIWALGLAGGLYLAAHTASHMQPLPTPFRVMGYPIVTGSAGLYRTQTQPASVASVWYGMGRY